MARAPWKWDEEARARSRLKSATRNKYNNKKTVVDGITFDSKAEAMRYADLLIRQKAKLIKHLQCQLKFDLFSDTGEKVCVYIADFVYLEKDTWIIEDVKGKETSTFRLKWKLLISQTKGKAICRRYPKDYEKDWKHRIKRSLATQKWHKRKAWEKKRREEKHEEKKHEQDTGESDI